MNKDYEVIIVGGGISGSSLLYTIANYSNVESVLLLEKCHGIAKINSSSLSNSQTLHFGDVETNYSIQTVKQIKNAATMVLNYIAKLSSSKRIHIVRKWQKMVLAIGDEEINALRKRHSELSRIFPESKILNREDIGRVEPYVVRNRDPSDRIEALFSEKGYAVDFGQLSESFIDGACKNRKSRIRVKLGSKVMRLTRSQDLFNVHTTGGTYNAKTVVINAGIYGLRFAKAMGYGRNLMAWPVAGRFYCSKNVLRGKVYRIQQRGVPFAAVHGDPDISRPDRTRFGPTVSLPLRLEARGEGGFVDYIKNCDFSLDTASALTKVMFDKDIRNILLKNMIYSLPYLGKRCFLDNEAGRIVPALRSDSTNIWFAKDIGGIRPQIIDKSKGRLIWGEVKLGSEGILFNINPSPGATSCLQNSVVDTKIITEYLGKQMYEDKLDKAFGSYPVILNSGSDKS